MVAAAAVTVVMLAAGRDSFWLIVGVDVLMVAVVALRFAGSYRRNQRARARQSALDDPARERSQHQPPVNSLPGDGAGLNTSTKDQSVTKRSGSTG